ncbi:hypothetical protein [Micrococcus terreus]|uniref:hypothetical protein n=1 Tax=Micrococcus terreus TaxID=574650 RepID=UPI0023F78341|nr:hypothetical protein [Micrococcus terreus]MDK7700517.1 hypothetical protein [Micrococcus terreus]WOO98830.1 hypothetical protein R3I42_06900 [Micrococcus terreus]
MTKYWVNIDECQRILDSIKDIMDGRRAVPPTRDDFEQIDSSCFTFEESGALEPKNVADRLHTALFDFEEQVFKPAYRELYETVMNNVNAMQDAVSYYASGDAEMALWNTSQRGDDLENFPDIISPSGNEPPEGRTTIPSVWDGTDIPSLERGYQSTPFVEAREHHEDGDHGDVG